MLKKIQPVVMAGGYGTRLWPLSSKQKPKQFLKLDGKFSLLQNTLIRNNAFAPPVIIINEEHINIAIEQINELNIEYEIVVEPRSKGTAICSIIASFIANSKNLDTLILLPSDHLINNTAEYINTIQNVASFVSQYDVTTIGIKPAHANTAYGYIECDCMLSQNIYLVRQFIEKPSKEAAEIFLAQKRFLWNSGIFLYNPDKFLSISESLEPDLFQAAQMSWKHKSSQKDLIYLRTEDYQYIKQNTIDYAFMEKIKNIQVIEGSFDWSDLGSFTNIIRSMVK
jgi:mannose-1-phosphate guanylyltransferase